MFPIISDVVFKIGGSSGGLAREKDQFLTKLLIPFNNCCKLKLLHPFAWWVFWKRNSKWIVNFTFTWKVCKVKLNYMIILRVLLSYTKINKGRKSNCNLFINRNCRKLFKNALSGLRQLFTTESPLKVMKNAF